MSSTINTVKDRAFDTTKEAAASVADATTTAANHAAGFVKEHPRSAGLPLGGFALAAVAYLVWWIIRQISSPQR